jgi:hypothetical protein
VGVEVTCDCLDNATDYVLGRLSPHERAKFIRHADYCEVCAEELELLNRAADASTLVISRALLPPVTDPADLPTTPESRSRTDLELETLAARGFPTPSEKNADAKRKSARTRKSLFQWGANGKRLAQPIPKPALAGLAGLLIVAVMTVMLSHKAASTSYVRGSTSWTTSGVAIQLNGNQGELLVANMPSPPAGEAYGVWILLKHHTTLTSTNLRLDLNKSGEAGVTLPGNIHDDAAIGVYPVRLATAHSTASVSNSPVAVVYLNRKN